MRRKDERIGELRLLLRLAAGPEQQRLPIPPHYPPYQPPPSQVSHHFSSHRALLESQAEWGCSKIS